MWIYSDICVVLTFSGSETETCSRGAICYEGFSPSLASTGEGGRKQIEMCDLHGCNEGTDIHHLWPSLLPRLHPRGDQVAEEVSYLSKEADYEKHTSHIHLDFSHRVSVLHRQNREQYHNLSVVQVQNWCFFRQDSIKRFGPK